jgi:hypothetical protein
VQTPELQHDEEPAEEHRAAGVQQVLPALPQAPAAQGEQVARHTFRDLQTSRIRDSGIAELRISKSKIQQSLSE